MDGKKRTAAWLFRPVLLTEKVYIFILFVLIFVSLNSSCTQLLYYCLVCFLWESHWNR